MCVCVCFNVEALLQELNDMIHCVDVGNKAFHLLCLKFKPCVIHIITDGRYRRAHCKAGLAVCRNFL